MSRADPQDEQAAAFLEAKAKKMEQAAARGSLHGDSFRHDANVLRAAASDIRAGLHRHDSDEAGHGA